MSRTAIVFPEDLQDHLVLGTVRVVNPFRVSPETRARG
jgi:predicted nucleic acid-binding protein